MSIRVNPLGTTVTYLRATASVSYTKGYAELGYINASAGIYLNYASKNKALTEEVLLSDLPAVTLTKAATDSVSLVDYSDFLIGKAPSDALVFSDDASITSTFSRIFADILTVSDEIYNINGDSFALGENVLNSIPLNGGDVKISGVSIQPYLPYTEETTLTDVQTASINKVINDALILSDTLNLQVGIYTSTVEQAVLSDIATINFVSGYGLNSYALNSVPLN